MWITSGSIADVAVIWAKLERRRTTGYAASLSRRTGRDSRRHDIHGKWSLRASVTSSLSLQDVRMPAENLLPERAD